MAQKRVLVFGAFLISAAVGAPAMAMSASGGALSDPAKPVVVPAERDSEGDVPSHLGVEPMPPRTAEPGDTAESRPVAEPGRVAEPPHKPVTPQRAVQPILPADEDVTPPPSLQDAPDPADE